MSLHERFWRKVDRNVANGCWLWQASTLNGYGRIAADGHIQFAHRVAWIMASGEPIPTGAQVCHTCDTRGCVRNDEVGTYEINGESFPRFGHLFLANLPMNMADMVAKGRQATGNRHGSRTHPEAAIPPAQMSTILKERAVRGDEHWTRKYPERVPRGDASGPRQHPERIKRGDEHWSRRHPERLARGERNGMHTHPERRARGERVRAKNPAPPQRAEQNARAYFTWEQVNAWRAQHAAGGISQREMARQAGIPYRTMWAILKRQRWWDESAVKQSPPQEPPG